MLNIEQTLEQKFPSFEQRGSWLKKPTVGFLKKLMHENEVNQFLEDHQDDEGFDSIDQVLNSHSKCNSLGFKEDLVRCSEV